MSGFFLQLILAKISQFVVMWMLWLNCTTRSRDGLLFSFRIYSNSDWCTETMLFITKTRHVILR